MAIAHRQLFSLSQHPLSKWRSLQIRVRQFASGTRTLDLLTVAPYQLDWSDGLCKTLE
ncbi:MAG: hypothetical protein AAFU78_18085 [Cyanobacteria bacterium J06633_2]